MRPTFPNALPNLLLFGVLLALALACVERPAVVEGPVEGPSGEWDGWRGPLRDGTVPVEGLDRSWENGEPKQIWRRALGEGFGGISVVDGRAHVLYGKGSREFLAALDAQSGEDLWQLEIGETLSQAVATL